MDEIYLANGPLSERQNRDRPDKLYPYSSIGLTLSVPIFSGLQRGYQLQQENFAWEK